MKIIADLTKAILDEEFYNQQFENFTDDGRNILFLNSQLSGKQLYKTFLPYLGMYNSKVLTGITGIEKYNPREQLSNLEITINTKQILWADIIVIPFTTLNLTTGGENLYEAIRRVNPQCKIIFSVDFNYYTLSDKHPYKDIFTKEAIKNIEENIWYADVCMLNNVQFTKYILEKMKELGTDRMRNIPTTCAIACMPFLINSDLVLGNVDFDPQLPQKIDGFVEYDSETKEQLNKVTETAESKGKKQIKVLFENDKWVLKKGNYKKPIETYANKKLAMDETKKWVEQEYDILIYKKDGDLQKSIIQSHKKK